jgi:predicted dehydrogenase
VKKKIIIIGKSPIALRHYNILRLIDKNFFFYFLDSNKRVWVYKNNKFFKVKNYFFFDKLFLVVICTPSNLHLNFINKFAKKTKYIFVEKPITNNFKKFLSFKNQVFKSNNFPKLIIGYNLRFTNSLNKFKTIINKKNLGKLLYVTTRVGMSLNQWRGRNLKLAASKKKTGGGVVLELSHELDYLNWIFGPIKHGYSLVNKIKKFKINVEENYFAILFTKKKVPVNLIVDMVRINKIRFCEAVFSNGTVTVNLLTGTIEVLNEFNKKCYSFKNDIDNSYKKMWLSFFEKKNNLRKILKESYNLFKIINQIKKK